MKVFTKIGSIVLVLLLVLSMLSANLVVMAESEADRIISQINSTYSTALSLSGVGSFDGLCGAYVRWQLIALGVISESDGDVRGNGNQMYNNTKSGTTSTGYEKIKYSGNNCLYDIIGNNTGYVYNILVSWSYQYGASYSNPGAGHATFIHAIIDNVVYFSESYVSRGVAAGAPHTCSVSEFYSRYNGSYGDAIGAVHFTTSQPTNSYATIENGEYYLKNVATGQYLSVDGGYDAQAQNVSVADYTGGNEMKFEFVSESNGYALRPLCSASRMLNIYADNVVSGKNVCIYDNTYHSSQRWRFEAVDGGYIIHSSNNPSCVLDVSGTNVLVNTNTGADSQKWVVESENTAVLPDKPTLAVVPGTSESDTQFTWEATANTDSYTLHIYNKTEDWEMPLFSDITDLFIDIPLPEGEYTAWLASINDELKDTDLWYTESDSVDFSVEGVHYHEYYVLEENPGDCQNYGYTIYQCDCGESYIEESTEFGDHIPSEWTVIFMPTETERGLACKLCTLCNVQTEYLRFDDEDNMFYPQTPEEPEDPGYDYPMTFTIDAEINDSKTGDILFSWNEHTGVSYYNLKVFNYAIEEELNVDVYDTSFLWEDVTCDAGMFTIAAMDKNGNMLGESALVKFERMFIMGDWWGQYGDADLDGKINIKDATVVQKVCAKFMEFDDTAFGAANVNYDDKINIKDATAIQKYLAHIESNSRVGEEYFYGFTQYDGVYLEL